MYIYIYINVYIYIYMYSNTFTFDIIYIDKQSAEPVRTKRVTLDASRDTAQPSA